MSAGKSTPRSVTTYIEVFEEAILGSQMRGLAGDWNKMRRKVEALSQRVRNREADGARAPDWAYRLEQKLLIEVMREWLLPAVIDDLIENLRSQGERGGADLGVWTPLDREITERHHRHEFSADTVVLAALKHYAKKPSHVRILEGLRALEDLQEIRESLDLRLSGEPLVNEGRHLAAALETALPPTVRQMLSLGVEARSDPKSRARRSISSNPPGPSGTIISQTLECGARSGASSDLKATSRIRAAPGWSPTSRRSMRNTTRGGGHPCEEDERGSAEAAIGRS